MRAGRGGREGGGGFSSAAVGGRQGHDVDQLYCPPLLHAPIDRPVTRSPLRLPSQVGYLDFIPRLLAPAPPVVPQPPSPRPPAPATDADDGSGTEGEDATAAAEDGAAADAAEERGVWRDLELVVSAFFTSFFPTTPAGLDDNGVPAAAGFGAM